LSLLGAIRCVQPERTDGLTVRHRDQVRTAIPRRGCAEVRLL
jgi:hypothetical protein